MDDIDLIVTHLDLDLQEAVLDSLESSADTWATYLNCTGRDINPDKSRWFLVSYMWINGIWRYHQQPEVDMTILLPDRTRTLYLQDM